MWRRTARISNEWGGCSSFKRMYHAETHRRRVVYLMHGCSRQSRPIFQGLVVLTQLLWTHLLSRKRLERKVEVANRTRIEKGVGKEPLNRVHGIGHRHGAMAAMRGGRRGGERLIGKGTLRGLVCRFFRAQTPCHRLERVERQGGC